VRFVPDMLLFVTVFDGWEPASFLNSRIMSGRPEDR
jgi:hypothetical protein